jgi:3-deoxy-7-phosphoheptulonate synthase
VMAGPCAIESEEQMMAAALAAKRAGASVLRGGAFKPRTSPYDFQGLGEKGLELLSAAGRATGLPVVTEVVDSEDVDLVARHADILQIGARNMSAFRLLQRVAETGKPILLKRGLQATIKEWLLAAEYILSRGNSQVILCERGIRTNNNEFTRNTLDIAAVPVLKKETHLPVIVDPSHATGRADLVEPMCRAALAVGADGVLIEMHPWPQEALCDGKQSVTREALDQLMCSLRMMAPLAGRAI